MKVTKEMVDDACVGCDIVLDSPVHKIIHALFFDGEVANVAVVKDGAQAIKRHFTQAMRVKTDKWIAAQRRIRKVQYHADMRNPAIIEKPKWEDVEKAILEDSKAAGEVLANHLIDNFDHEKVTGLVLPVRPEVVRDDKAKEQAELAAKRRQVFKRRKP